MAFHPTQRLTALDVEEVLATVEPGIRRLLARRGLGEGAEDGSQVDAWADEAPVLAGLAAASVQGTVARGSQLGARPRRLGDRREEEAEHIDLPCRDHERRRAQDEQRNRYRPRQELVTTGCARVALVHFPIGDPVEKHRRSARKNHRQHDQPAQFHRRQSARRDEHRAERKRQRKDGVRKADEAQSVGNHRNSGVAYNCGWPSRARGSSGSSKIAASRSSTRKSISFQTSTGL